MDQQFKIPTEQVELPSKGLLYSKDSPLSKGVVEMKYMTAREEDILTNVNFIKKGVVVDKLLQSLIVTEGINYDDILIGDKNALMVAARILSYGKDYETVYSGTKITVDLTTLKPKEVDYSLYSEGKNEFPLEFKATGNLITFKLLTHGDEKKVDREGEGLMKINKNNSTEVTTRLKYMITSINGSREIKDIREFVDKGFLAVDARELRKEYSKVSPDVNMVFEYEDEDGGREEVNLPIGIDFFWPDGGI